MKRILIMSLILSLRTGISLSQTILQPGDIAIVGYNFKNPDEFTFITFVDLEPGTIIYITDCGWTSNNDFRPGEGIVTYTVPTGGKVKGSAITFGIDPGFTTTGVSGFFGLSTAGDQLIVYQGNFGAPQFIYALNCNGNAGWQSDAPDNNTSALPPGLINGYSAVALIEKEDGVYNCSSVVMDKDQMLPLISNFNNWLGDDINRFLLPPSCFTDPLSADINRIRAKITDGILELQISLQPGATRTYILELSGDYMKYDSISTIQIGENINNFSYKISLTQDFSVLKLRKMNSAEFYGPVIIDHQTNQRGISIYPNPYTSGNIRIFIPDNNADCTMQVVNHLGQRVLNIPGSNQDIEAELQSFATQTIKGSYYVILQTPLKIYRQKLIIE
jgi:hypothetical protein